MKKERRNLLKQLTSFVLAAVMMVSIIGILPQNISAAEYVLPSKGGTIAITDDTCSAVTNQVDYWKYKATQDGYLELKFKDASSVVHASGMAQLFNNKKKNITPAMNYSTSSNLKTNITEYYGVQKGKTYYIGVLSTGGVNISVKFTKAVLKKGAGSKKAKAINIPKGKKGAVGTIAAGTSAARWYKFKLTKNQRFTFSLTPYLTSTVSYTISGPGVNTRTFTMGANWWGEQDPVSTDGSVRAGTYYVKVKPASKLCTGYYKLNWK